MNKFIKWSFLAAFSFSAGACKGTPAGEPSRLEVSAEELLFWPQASSKTVQVSGHPEFTATLADFLDRSWCGLEIVAGKTGNLVVSVTDNPEVRVERSAQIIIGAAGMDNKVITVRQTAPEPELSVKEKQVVVNENERLVFSLEITANIPLTFELPAWVQAGNTTAAGNIKICSFTVVPLSGEEMTREDNLVVRAADPATFSNSVAIPIRQNRMTCTLCVASYNIRYQNSGDENAGNGWSIRKTMINTLVRSSYDFDIFGVQEALKTQIDDILAPGGYSYIGAGRDDGLNAGEHSAIIYKTDKFEVLDKGNFWYSTTPDVPSMGWDAVCCKRICSWGKFRELDSGREFYFFSSHYDHQGVTARIESAKLMVSKIKAIAGAYPVFATGDYNSTAQSDAIRYILNDGLLRDSRAQSETQPAGTLGTSNGFTLSLTQMDENHRIDYIFLNSNTRVKQYSVINDRPNGKYPSDHDPVLIVAEF